MVELYQSSKGPVSDDHDVATSRFRSLTGFFRIIFVGLTAIGILLAVHQILGLQILSRIVLLENRGCFSPYHEALEVQLHRFGYNKIWRSMHTLATHRPEIPRRWNF